MRGLRDLCDRVLRAGCALDIGEEEDPAVPLEPSTELPDDAGLAHAPLAGQQDVIAIPDEVSQYPQFGLAIEEVVAAHPAAGG